MLTQTRRVNIVRAGAPRVVAQERLYNLRRGREV